MGRKVKRSQKKPPAIEKSSPAEATEDADISFPVATKAKKKQLNVSFQDEEEEHMDEKSEIKNEPRKDEDKKPAKSTGRKKKGKKEEYEVDEIVGMEINTRKRCPITFRVRWVGFGEKDDTWVPLSNLNCDDLMKDFLEISGRKPEYDKALEKYLRDTGADYSITLRTTHRRNYNESDNSDEEEMFFATSTRTRRTKAPEYFNPCEGRRQLLKAPKSANGSAKTVNREPSNADEGNGEYEVAMIVDHRVRGRFTDYKVRWKGLPSSQDTWTPEADLNCPKLVAEYHNTVSNDTDHNFEVSSIIDSREIGGQVSYKVRWKGFSAKFDSWLSKDEMNCPELVEKFENALENLHKKEDWVVNKIKAQRELNGETQYLVNWYGFDSTSDTWEPEENLSSCPDKLEDFLAKQQTKISKRSKAKQGEQNGEGTGGKRRKLRTTLDVSYVEEDVED